MVTLSYLGLCEHLLQLKPNNLKQDIPGGLGYCHKFNLWLAIQIIILTHESFFFSVCKKLHKWNSKSPYRKAFRIHTSWFRKSNRFVAPITAIYVWLTCNSVNVHVCESYLSSLSVPILILMVWTPLSQPLSRISPTGEQRVTSRSTQWPRSDIANCTQQATCCQNAVKHM